MVTKGGYQSRVIHASLQGYEIASELGMTRKGANLPSSYERLCEASTLK